VVSENQTTEGDEEDEEDEDEDDNGRAYANLFEIMPVYAHASKDKKHRPYRSA
jgi:hypothetical protein